MFTPREPSPDRIERLLASQARLSVSYADVGVTRGEHAPTRPRNHHRARLGSGEDDYRAAVAAMRRWAMYDLPWTRVHPAAAPVAQDVVFATVVHHLGFWSVNPCRVVYVEEQDGEVRSFTFAIGTLPDHAEVGEERFRAEWHRADDSVWFEVLAYADAHHWLARLGRPVVRLLQRRFGEQALTAMQRAVGASHTS